MHFPITDSHLHLLDKNTFNYPWLASMPSLDQPYLLTDLMDATKSLFMESFVFVQTECEPSQSLAEVNWITKLAERDARIHGIVAQASLEQGSHIKPHLATLKNNPLVKGVRRFLQLENNDFCIQTNFIDGVKLLKEFDFSFDISINAKQLANVIRLVEQCPDVTFILNHMGRPDIASNQMQPWKNDLADLAAFPNVWCKVSGLISEQHHHTWRSENLKPYLQHAIEKFSFDRIMFGSDWPMVNLTGSFAHWVHTLHDLLSDFAEQDLRKLFHDNAQRCYKLK